MVRKSTVVTVDIDYLATVARQRGVSRTRLMQLLVEKAVRDQLVGEIVTEADVAADVRPPRYRRFPPRS